MSIPLALAFCLLRQVDIIHGVDTLFGVDHDWVFVGPQFLAFQFLVVIRSVTVLLQFDKLILLLLPLALVQLLQKLDLLVINF